MLRRVANTLEPDHSARSAAATAAVELIEPGMTIGLGSGRAVWRVVELVAERWPDRPPLRAVCASVRTAERARAAGIESLSLAAETRLDLAIDGADEIDADLGAIKGGGGALLREKLVAAAAERFVVVAEEPKRVARLGGRHLLPVEVVRFGWEQTRRRLEPLIGTGARRETAAGEPFVTDEGHYLLDCRIPPAAAPEQLARELKAAVGVVEHGLFLGIVDLALIGLANGDVETLTRSAARG